MSALEAFHDALAAELDIDLSPEFCAAADRVLMRLWLLGYTLAPAPDDSEVAEAVF